MARYRRDLLLTDEIDAAGAARWFRRVGSQLRLTTSDRPDVAARTAALHAEVRRCHSINAARELLADEGHLGRVVLAFVDRER